MSPGPRLWEDVIINTPPVRNGFTIGLTGNTMDIPIIVLFCLDVY